MKNLFAQVIAELDGKTARFFMDYCDGRDQVVRAVMNGGWASYEPPLPLLIARLICSGPTTFVDVGANTGYYSLLAAAFGAQGVWAFEPEPSICEILNRNVAASGLQANFHVVPCAIGETPGQLDLYLPDAAHGLIETSASLNPGFRAVHSRVHTVQVETLDSQFIEASPWAQPPSVVVMKIDVESFEPQVIRGGTRFIEQYRPVFVAEILAPQEAEFFARFASDANYRHYRLDSAGQLVWIKGVCEVSLQERDHVFVPLERLDAFLRAMTSR